jgi:hypothetical protein
MSSTDFPRLGVVRQLFPPSPALDIPARVQAQLGGVRDSLPPGARVAIAVGSRGISNLAAIVQATVECLRQSKARPFVVPAMGSHGGGTVEGQLRILAQYGITEAALGAPIHPGLGVKTVGQTPAGFEVVFSTEALRADAILLINRVKPHTDFRGALGSGLLKMLVVGLGKPRGAANYHTLASRLGYEQVIRDSARIILGTAPVLGGLALLEDQRHQTSCVEFVPAARMESREQDLCRTAGSLVPRLPFDDIDLLIVDRMGKNLSGTGLDPMVIGRSIHGYSLWEEGTRPPPRIRRLFVRELTPESLGNAIGIGLADFTTNRLVRAIDWRVTALNSLTAHSLQGAKVPLHFETDREIITVALGTLGLSDEALAKVVRIRDTLSLEHLEASEPCLALARQQEGLAVVAEPMEMGFDEAGNLAPLRRPEVSF